MDMPNVDNAEYHEIVFMSYIYTMQAYFVTCQIML